MRKTKLVFILGIIGALIILSDAVLIPNQEDAAQTGSWPEEPEGCTVIMVGKKASVDGSVMSTHAADCGICDFTWWRIPAADHESGSMRKIYHYNQLATTPPGKGTKWETAKKEGFTDLEIPESPRTYSYVHSVFGYMNEHQLAMAESTIGCRRKLRNSTTAPKTDITMLTLLAMERCRTAREAITLMGSLAEKYGYGFTDSGEMLAVSDPNEIWVFEIMPVGPLWTPESGKPGAVWCAQRVPDDHVCVCPNESRIGEIHLDNEDYFLYSPNVIDLAVEMGFYDPECGEPFSWKKAYSPSEGSAANTGGGRGRMWRFFDLVAPSMKFDPATPNIEFPFSVKPDQKLSVSDVMALTRDKYEGSFLDTQSGMKGGPFHNPNYQPRPFKVGEDSYSNPRYISVNSVEYTTLTQCRDWLPDPIGGIVWIAFGAQDTSCYIPLYAGVTDIPESFSTGDHWVFDRDSARWAFDYVDYHVQVAYSHAVKDVHKAREQWEKSAVERTAVIDKTAKELYDRDPELAVEFITYYCLSNADSVIDAWWKLGDSLLVKYNHFRMYDPETRKVSRVSYPDWWLKEVVKYHGLKPRPKRRDNK